MSQIKYLEERLQELKIAETRLKSLTENENMIFYKDEVLMGNLVRVQREQQQVIRKLEELKNVR